MLISNFRYSLLSKQTINISALFEEKIKQAKMNRKNLRDLYCYLCNLQFEKRCIYDMHTSIIHKYKETRGIALTQIKKEPNDIESNNIQPTLNENQNLMRKTLKSKISYDNTEPIQCKICDAFFFQKGNLKTHIASVHEGKKPFTCKDCEVRFDL